MNRIKLLLGVCLFALCFSASATAAGGGHVEHAGINNRDIASTQNGAKIFVNYCMSCHSASYMRYKRLAQDLDLDEDAVMENMVFSDANIGDTMTTSMPADQALKWFGKTPPDLSVIARSRGVDWLFTYMKSFYQDDSGGWNNLALPNASMPHVMWQLQGIQKPVFEEHGNLTVIDHLVLDQPGMLTPEEYDETVRDLVTFLDYLGEPAKLKRKNVGIWVMMFLTIFAAMTYLLKAEYWRDIH
jgi:ubiquinol-cytochrome c reductase cytochrome c1 subunit